MKGMTIIVKTISSWVKVLIFLFGIYIILFGHLTPGGGFAGGVILASCYVLLMLAFGRERIRRKKSASAGRLKARLSGSIYVCPDSSFGICLWWYFLCQLPG